MADTTTPKKRTITLTGRRPVTIREDEWPVIAEADYEDHDSERRVEALRLLRRMLRVRQHRDGRAIVYGLDDYTTRWQHERGHTIRRGVLLEPGADLPAAIHTVAHQLASDAPDVPSLVRLPAWHMIAEECIADLPAEDV